MIFNPSLSDTNQLCYKFPVHTYPNSYFISKHAFEIYLGPKPNQVRPKIFFFSKSLYSILRKNSQIKYKLKTLQIYSSNNSVILFRSRYVEKNMSRMIVLLLHLTVADLSVSF